MQFKLWKPVLSGVVFSCALTAATAPADSAQAASPASGVWSFNALLDGKLIGQHRFSLTTQGGERKLISDASFTVKFLGITAYRYRHQTTEQWQGDCLTALTSTTDDDGKPSRVRTESEGNALNVIATTPVHPAGAPAQSLTGCVMSFAYWNPLIQTQTRLLNAQNGKFESVKLTRVGTGSVDVRGQAVEATQFRINGLAAPIDIWYSTQGDWVGLDSMVAGGRKLSYRLKP
jgi:hypothetical protein